MIFAVTLATLVAIITLKPQEPPLIGSWDGGSWAFCLNYPGRAARLGPVPDSRGDNLGSFISLIIPCREYASKTCGPQKRMLHKTVTSPPTDPVQTGCASIGILSRRLRCKRSPNRIREIVDRLNGISGKAPGCEVRPRGNPMECAIEDIIHLW